MNLHFYIYILIFISHPQLPVAHPVLKNEKMATKSQRYNCFTNAEKMLLYKPVQKLESRNPITGLPNHKASNLRQGKSYYFEVCALQNH